MGLCSYRGSVVLKSEGFWNIVRLQSKTERGAFPGAAKRGLFKALVLAGAAVDDVQRRGEYWIQVQWFSHPSKGLLGNSVSLGSASTYVDLVRSPLLNQGHANAFMKLCAMKVEAVYCLEMLFPPAYS